MDQPTGIDVSSRQGIINWQAAKDAGLDFAFIKATEGTGYANPLFAANWAAAKQVGILRGAYHFFRWDQDPVQQAAYFMGTVGKTGDFGEFPLTVDVENTGDGAGVGTKNPARVRTFCDAVRKATGKSPIIYTYGSMWRDTLGNPQNFNDCPLWLAAYQPHQPRPVGGWSALTFWQNSASARVAGVQGLVDSDVFIGSTDDLRKFAGIDDDKPLFFEQTGFYVSHGFKEHYQANPGRNFGYPLTGEFSMKLEDGQDWTVQLFERGLLQYLPEPGVLEARVGFMLGKALGII